MLRYSLALILAFILQVPAQAANHLMVGDLLLQPTDCISCSMIEAEEESIYSHMGIVIEVSPEIKVAEALGKVRKVSLKDFSMKTEKGQRVAVYRFRNSAIVREFQKDSAFSVLFASDFEGLKYDHEFLWNNLDDDGQQKLYCSEMIAKMLQAFLGIDPLIKRMRFRKNREWWERYFKGNVPDGKWGNSPADYSRSDLFYHVGEL